MTEVNLSDMIVKTMEHCTQFNAPYYIIMQ